MTNLGNKAVDWQKHEREVNDELSVDPTIASGRTWTDKGDGTTRDHPFDNSLQLQVDEKCTSRADYKVNVHYMNDCVKRAAKEGKVFLLPIRFELGQAKDETYDYICLRLSDFKFMFGFDQIKKFRKDAEENKIAKSKFEAAVAKHLQSLDKLSADPDLKPEAKTAIS